MSNKLIPLTHLYMMMMLILPILNTLSIQVTVFFVLFFFFVNKDEFLINYCKVIINIPEVQWLTLSLFLFCFLFALLM